VRHQPDDPAVGRGDPGDVVQRAVRVAALVAEDDAPGVFQLGQRRGVGHVAAFGVLHRDDDLPALQVGGPGRLRLDLEPLVAADEVQARVAHERAREQARLAQDLEAVADAQHRQAPPGRGDDLGHDRRDARDRSRPQVVAVGEAAGHDHGVDPAQVAVGVPQRDGRAAREAHRARGVAVVERAGERDDADVHGAALAGERRVFTAA